MAAKVVMQTLSSIDLEERVRVFRALTHFSEDREKNNLLEPDLISVEWLWSDENWRPVVTLKFGRGADELTYICWPRWDGKKHSCWIGKLVILGREGRHEPEEGPAALFAATEEDAVVRLLHGLVAVEARRQARHAETEARDASESYRKTREFDPSVDKAFAFLNPYF